MLTNYLKVAIRSLLKRKVFSLINIMGLATGMAVCLLIVLFIRNELSYDSFEKDGDRIYRMVLERRYPERSTSYAIIPSAFVKTIPREYPEIEAATGLQDLTGANTQNIRIGDRIFEERHVMAADSDFFRVFQTELLLGDTAIALNRPNMAVLTETTAKKLFGSANNAIGKYFESEHALRMEVSGVIKDWPENSHITFNILMSMTTFPADRDPSYTRFSTFTYVLLKKNTDPGAMQAKFPRFIDKYVSGEINRSFGMTYEQFIASGNGYHYYLQPLQKIHLISDLESEMKPNGSMRAVYIFGVIAAFILGIACVNFINLSTARSMERAKEVGLRKTFGSEKSSLVTQFLMESTLVSLLSILVALGLIFALLPFFNRLSGKDLSGMVFLQPLTLLGLLAFGLLVGIIAGLYPAFVLSSFQPIKVLKGKFQTNKYGILLRNGLVVFQFAISIILIICTVVVNRQMSYMLGDKLGFRQDHVIEVQRTDLIDDRSRAFRNELAALPGVQDVSGVSSMPGDEQFFGTSWQIEGHRESMTGRGLVVDDQFMKTMGLELKEGRFFSRDYGTDSLSVVINEKAVKAFGLQGAVLGTRLTTTDDEFNKYKIVGVLKDFHFQTLHQAIAPLIVINNAKFLDRSPTTIVRVKGDDFANSIRAIEKVWRGFAPQMPFHYVFLDQRLAEQYKAEQTIQRIFTVFSVLAIFIACIGLLGLAAYATQQRIREISVRKILGATVPNIIGMLSKDFLRLVTISALFAFPLAWFAMHSWLQGFAYRVGLSWWIFVVAWVLSMAITLLTISFQALRAARTNPILTLRSE